METTLLLVGLVFFLVCTLLFLRLAFANSAIWGIMGLLFPPSAVLFYAVSWKKLKTLAFLHFASLVLLLLVSMMWVRANPYSLNDPRLSWLRDAWAPAFADKPLVINKHPFVSERELQPFLTKSHPGGKVRGEHMNFIRTTLVNNILRFKSDENIFSRVEIAISLDKVVLKPGENLLEYAPESLDSPVIHLIFYPEGQKVPDVQVYTHRFWLELLVTVKDGIVYSGYVKLRLPDRFRSFMAGEFRAYTRDLRFNDDVVDRLFDSNATIEYVTEQYLSNKLGNRLARIIGFQDTFFQTALENPTAHTEVTLKLDSGRESTLRISLLKGNDGWVVDNGPTAELIEALKELREAPPAAIRVTPAREHLRMISLDALETLVGQSVVISTRDGKLQEGTIRNVDQQNVTLSQTDDGGAMGILVKRRDITEVKLQH